MTGHTKEPWEENGFQIRQTGTRWPICQLPLDDFDYKANARRIVDCVNALAGIPDPAAYVAAMEHVANEADWLCRYREHATEWHWDELAAALTAAHQARGGE